jgi:hypothetical protein
VNQVYVPGHELSTTEMKPFLCSYPILRSRYRDWLRAGSRRGRSSSPGRVKNFLHVAQTGSGLHPASYPTDTGGSFPGGKAAGA